jgi:hypothetical protein
VKKFEKVLNEFEFKSLVLVVFEKQKKKRKPYLFTFLAQPACGPPILLSQRPVSSIFFFFSSQTLTCRPHLSALPFPPASLPSSASRRRPGLRRAVHLPLALLPSLSGGKWQLIPSPSSSLNCFAVSQPHHPQCQPATYGKAAGRRPPSASPPSLFVSI